MTTLPVSIYEEKDTYNNLILCQSMQNVNDNDPSVNFTAWSFDCLEDASIEGDLFDCYDYINTVNLGIELAKQGYDKVELVSLSSGPFE